MRPDDHPSGYSPPDTPDLPAEGNPFRFVNYLLRAIAGSCGPLYCLGNIFVNNRRQKFTASTAGDKYLVVSCKWCVWLALCMQDVGSDVDVRINRSGPLAISSICPNHDVMFPVTCMLNHILKFRFFTFLCIRMYDGAPWAPQWGVGCSWSRNRIWFNLALKYDMLNVSLLADNIVYPFVVWASSLIIPIRHPKDECL